MDIELELAKEVEVVEVAEIESQKPYVLSQFQIEQLAKIFEYILSDEFMPNDEEDIALAQAI